MVKEGFLKHVRTFKRIKSTVSADERQTMILKARVLSSLVCHYNITISTQEFQSIAMAL
jgi:hypothetical protein